MGNLAGPTISPFLLLEKRHSYYKSRMTPADVQRWIDAGQPDTLTEFVQQKTGASETPVVQSNGNLKPKSERAELPHQAPPLCPPTPDRAPGGRPATPDLPA